LKERNIINVSLFFLLGVIAMNGKITKPTQFGFSLIELIIVVVIIGVIASIAIPNIIATRRSANEASAISSVRVLHGAQLSYKTTLGAGNYAGATSSTGDTAGLATLGSLGLIDSVLAAGSKSSYNFVGAMVLSSSSTPATFFFSANPVSSSGVMKTGTRRFCITQQGVIGADSSNLGTAFDETTVLSAPPLEIY
jgi:type IV pilus assembly protein PilA